MDMPDFAALFAQHRTPILAAGAGLAVVLGLRARSSSKASSSAGGNGSAVVATGPAYAGKGGVYDSTANDVYNSIQPQIGNLAGQLATLASDLANEKAAGVVARSSFGAVLERQFGTRADAIGAALRSRTRGALSTDAGVNPGAGYVPSWIDVISGMTTAGGTPTATQVQTGWQRVPRTGVVD